MCFALLAWFARVALLAGIAKTATGKTCNEWKTLIKWGWSVFKWSDTMLFSKQPFSWFCS